MTKDIKSKFLKTQPTFLALTLIIHHKAKQVFLLLHEYMYHMHSFVHLSTIFSQILATLPSQAQTSTSMKPFVHSFNKGTLNKLLVTNHIKKHASNHQAIPSLWREKDKERNHCNINNKQYKSGIYQMHEGRNN